jgi:CIC family chloride channel protein
MLILAIGVGLLAGFGAALFTLIIEFVTDWTYGGANTLAQQQSWWLLGVVVSPIAGLLLVSYITRTFAPEAQGHGVPEVIMAVARNDGVIRPVVAVVKIVASGLCIGTGGSVGREGPIVQIGATLGSLAGQTFKLSGRKIKTLVAAGGAAGIGATFNAPLAGVVFASEIILGSFAVESLTPVVIAAVVATVVQQHVGEHGFDPAFRDLDYDFGGAYLQLPSFLVLGLVAGLAAVGFSRLLYATEDHLHRWVTRWWCRALAVGLLVGISGVAYPPLPPTLSSEATQRLAEGHPMLPPLMGVGYGVVDHSLHLDFVAGTTPAENLPSYTTNKHVVIDRAGLWRELWWLLPLVFLKPLLTSLTLAGGGSGGVFAPSLYIGATLGACIGIVSNLVAPEYSSSPGMYAIVGMGAVVAGTTHGVMSAILIVYEMTGRYEVILPIMAAAGLSSLISRAIDPDSIYYKKLRRRGDHIARGHDMHRLDHIMVRDVMVRRFPMLKHTDTVTDIIRIAKENPHIESLPVAGGDGKLIGIIRAEDLHRVLDSDISPYLVNAEDIALRAPLSVSPNENLIEALRDFGTRDVETLPVEVGQGPNRRIVGLLLRGDVMARYRQEMLSQH